MLDFNNDARTLKTESIRGRNNIFAPIGTAWRYLRLVTHGPQQACDKLLHFLPVKLTDLVLNKFECAALNVSKSSSTSALSSSSA